MIDIEYSVAPELSMVLETPFYKKGYRRLSLGDYSPTFSVQKNLIVVPSAEDLIPLRAGIS